MRTIAFIGKSTPTYERFGKKGQLLQKFHSQSSKCEPQLIGES
jgi:hypothetical protein